MTRLAVCLSLFFALGAPAQQPARAVVTFRVDGGGTLTATVDGDRIASGDSVSVNKFVIFTAVPAEGYGVAYWTVNGAVIVDTRLVIASKAPTDVTVSFEKKAEPPPPPPPDPPPEPPTEALSGVLTFGPSPVRSGGEVAIFWTGNKAVGGELSVFNSVGDIVAVVSVRGTGKIGIWNTRSFGGGTYMMNGMLKDKDGFKCRVRMLVGVVK